MELPTIDLSYKCSVCATVIRNISEFQKHLSHCQTTNREHRVNLNDGDSLYCGVCCVEMPDVKEIQLKLETENLESDYYRTSFESLNCLMCHKVFMSNGDLLDHQKRDHFESKFENRFACIRCLNKTNKFAQISNDSTNPTINATTKENTFCSICDKFIKTTAWSRHMRNHRDRVVYQCESCGKIRIGFLRFQNHFRQSTKCSNSMEFLSDKTEKESRSYTYQCEKCKQTFTRRAFKGHIEESECYKENHCTICLKRFITKSALNEHRLVADCVKIENETKVERCATCKKAFYTRKGLILHSNVCRKNRKRNSNRCDICKIPVESEANHWNDIHRRKSVVKLKRIADVERTKCTKKETTGVQFGCLLCDDTFNDRQLLKFHMKIHYCDKAVQTIDEDPSEKTLVDTHIDAFNFKDEKIESSLTVDLNIIEDENKFQFLNPNEFVKTESVVNFELQDMWTLNSDNLDNFADDGDAGETSDEITGNDVMQQNIRGNTNLNAKMLTMCCLCKNVIPDLTNTNDVVQQQIARFGESICLICFQLFNNMEKLREHESSHFHDNLDGHSIACRSCAWSSNVYYTHDDFFRMENELQCYMCSTKMGDLRTLRRHKRSHLSLCVYTCKVCNKKSISEERHRNHIRKHQKPELTVVTNQIIRKCTMCGEVATNLFRNEDDIDRMFEKFNGGPCKICFTYINDKKRYISHERAHMEDQQLVSCFKCCNSQHYNDDEYHRLEEELKCFICDAKLSSKYNLHLHKRRHLDRVVYSCTICLSLVGWMIQNFDFL